MNSTTINPPQHTFDRFQTQKLSESQQRKEEQPTATNKDRETEEEKERRRTTSTTITKHGRGLLQGLAGR